MTTDEIIERHKAIAQGAGGDVRLSRATVELITRLREGLYECANLARAWTDKEKEAPDLLDTVYSVASKATA